MSGNMYEAIKNFSQQFLYEPEIKNQRTLGGKSGFIVVGMGGSALASELLKVWKPELDIKIHHDYGLPKIHITEIQKKLIILSSYSGNTEEVIEAFKEAKEKNLEMVVISTGGELLVLAKKNNVPYIQLPDTGIQPRCALGFSLRALLKFLGEENELKELSKLAETLKPLDFEEKGKMLAEKMKNCVPVIYASNRNLPLACIWKIKMNETGKIPAFYNVLPELNHNEMTGFDVADSTKTLSNQFYFIILKDAKDDPRILKRMEVLEKLYKNRSFKIQTLALTEKYIWQKLFSSIILADWIAYYIALGYGLDPEQVPMVEEFKKLILR